MAEFADRILQLMREAESLSEGPQQIALVEEAVRVADLHNDLDWGFRCRRRLMSAAMCGGQPDLLMVAFAWCLAQSERDPKRFDTQELLWAFRWVIFELTSFPQVKKEKIEELKGEMVKRYEAAGSTMRGYHLLCNRVAVEMGDVEASNRTFETFKKCKRDWLSDSEETEIAFEVLYRNLLADDGKTLHSATPILRNVYKSELYQGIILSTVLLPLLRLRRVPEAMSYHLRSYRLISRNPRYIDRVGDHIIFLTLTDNLGKAATLLQKHMYTAITSVDVSSRFDFYLACRLMLGHLAEGGKRNAKLRLPQQFPLCQESGEYDLARLTGWFDEQTADLARQFDARNGNRFFQSRLENLSNMKKWRQPLPLPASAVAAGHSGI
ncbi:MAG TPA: hypothetical protein VGZ47_20885 [Gemmataceae bacterium]|jgi:hypothetical protein|nr:hypothetical protein [Gemmataceae bacterium]